MFVYMFMFMLVNKEKCSYHKWKFYVVEKKKKKKASKFKFDFGLLELHLWLAQNPTIQIKGQSRILFLFILMGWESNHNELLTLIRQMVNHNSNEFWLTI